jgi:hypothetical protein
MMLILLILECTVALVDIRWLNLSDYIILSNLENYLKAVVSYIIR